MCGDVQANPGPCHNNTGGPYSDNHRTSKNILRCMSLNARSVCNRLNEFHDLVKMSNVDMVAVTETWPRQSILDTAILNSNYITFRQDRPTRSANDNSTTLDLLITSVPEFDADFDGLQEVLKHTPWDVVYDENDMDFSNVKWIDPFFLQLSTIVSPRLR
ncbi:unnamed protein product [Pocillopora meandrina]|uniref:Endonuclease/exonuclease/phosphatase domain-containing protein n=1 Tax=Pocillopora meandrina TaxID=46732 RepID=A0AAU9WB56_9CNID|nr:unnamed protein product [Pocillopora meandrina]